MRKRVLQTAVIGVFAAGLVLGAAGIGNSTKMKPELSGAAWQTGECRERGWSGNGTSLVYHGITYCFDADSFDEKDAEALVWKVDRALSYMDTVFPGEAEDMRIYVGFADGEVPEKKNVIALADSDLTVDMLWKIQKGRNTDSLYAGEQYGLLYAFCLDNGIVEEKPGKEEAQMQKEQLRDYFNEPEHLILLDFTLPMLENVYFTDEEAQMTQLAVREFVKWQEETYGREASEQLCLTTEGADLKQLEAAKNEWLESIGCDADYTEYGKIAFQYNNYEGTYSNDYHMKNTLHVTYKIDRGDAIWLWANRDVADHGYREMVEKYEVIEPLRAYDFAQAREYMKDYLPDHLENVKICTNLDLTITSPSFYTGSNSTITINCSWADVANSLLHEYIHHLTWGEGKILEKDSFTTEWFPTLLETFELENREKSQLVPFALEVVDDYVDRLKEQGSWDEEKQAYSCALGRMRYTLSTHYQLEKERADSMTDGKYPVSVADLTYAQRAVMAKYLVDTYGFDQFVKLAQGEGFFEEVYGKTYQDLYFEMIDWLKPQMEGDPWLEEHMQQA